jgi:hypothetical protein
VDRPGVLQPAGLGAARLGREDGRPRQDHDNGIILLPGKSPDTKWGQLLLATADMVLYPRGRFAFHYPDGTVSKGKWNPMIYAAYGEVNVSKLVTFESTVLPGILMESIGSRGMAELREKYDY